MSSSICPNPHHPLLPLCLQSLPHSFKDTCSWACQCVTLAVNLICMMASEKEKQGTSLVVQPGLGAFTARAWVQSLVGEQICKSGSTALKKKKIIKAKQKLSSIDCWMSSHYPVSFLLSKRNPESSKPKMSLAKGSHFDASFVKCVANVI